MPKTPPSWEAPLRMRAGWGVYIPSLNLTAKAPETLGLEDEFSFSEVFPPFRRFVNFGEGIPYLYIHTYMLHIYIYVIYTFQHFDHALIPH